MATHRCLGGRILNGKPQGPPARPPPLWLALRLPGLPLQALTTVADQPLVVSEQQAGRGRIIGCNRAAHGLGLRRGMTLNTAYALQPGLRVMAREPAREQALLQRLAAWALQFSAWVHLPPDAGLLLEVGGSLQLFDGPEAMLERVPAALRELGYQGRAALAPTPAAAWWLCREAATRRLITDPDALEAALRPLPIAVLGLAARPAGTLKKLGATTIGDCLDLPRQGLARRLDRRVPLLLDQALGRAPDPRPAFHPPPRFEAHQLLPAALDRSADLLLILRRLVLELVGFLIGHGRGVEGLAVQLYHHGDRYDADTARPVTRPGVTRPGVTHLGIELSAPSRDPEHLFSLVRRRLERVELDAPVIEVGLIATRLTRLGPEARSLLPENEPAAGDRQRLLERLRARLGGAAVSGLCRLPDHRPERAWGRCEPGERTSPVAADEPHEPQPELQPLWLLEQPRLLPRQRGQGPWLDGWLSLEQGPRRIETGWWDGAEVTRDYYVARHPAGERYWVFKERQAPQRWFLHGLFG